MTSRRSTIWLPAPLNQLLAYPTIYTINEGSKAEVGQVIIGTKSDSFFLSQTWRQKTMPDMASGYPSTVQIDAMSGIVFDAMSGVKKLTDFVPAITCITSTNEPSD